MDWYAYAEQLGRVKQNQIRMVLARGCEIDLEEAALLETEPLNVTRHFRRRALELKCSVPSAMNRVYTRTIHGVCERMHVVYVGLRIDDNGGVKQVPIDALRAAILSVTKAEGGAFSTAMELSGKRRRFGALRDALTTHAGSVAGDAAARYAQTPGSASTSSSLQMIKKSNHAIGIGFTDNDASTIAFATADADADADADAEEGADKVAYIDTAPISRKRPRSRRTSIGTAEDLDVDAVGEKKRSTPSVKSKANEKDVKETKQVGKNANANAKAKAKGTGKAQAKAKGAEDGHEHGHGTAQGHDGLEEGTILSSQSQSHMTVPASLSSYASVSAVIVVPAPLTSDAAKEAARAREWLSVLEYSQLAFPLAEHADVLRHDFMRGEAAQAALSTLRVEMQDMPILKREEPVALYFGARPGDVARVQKPLGVVHWMAVR